MGRVVYSLLIELIREALWGVPFDGDISPKEVLQLIDVAQKQTVAGLVIDILIKKNVRMNRQTVLEVYGVLSQIKRENELMNQEMAVFAQLMADTGTDYLVVKGQTLATLYPEPLIRMPGDIDFVVRDYHHVAKVLKEQWGVGLPRQMAEKEVSFMHGAIIYELHTYLIDFGSNKHKRYWEQALAGSDLSSVIIGGEKVKVMEPTLYAVYIFIHLFFHFVREGIGLRHLCDWAVMMHHYADEIDKERLSEVLKNVGLLNAFLAFGTILVDKLGMKDFPLPLSLKDRKFQSHILKDIMQGGNFGRNKRKVTQVGLRYKIETMVFLLKNCVRYYALAPKEMLLIPYRRMAVNMKLFTRK
ncbi:MAG: nucleotidyltransferase family protein [Prevotella sp.]|nr:nucleotidyltransferase family protein [Prevotella sp.]